MRFRYIYVFPPLAVFREVQACYRRAAFCFDWIRVEDLSDWSPKRSEWKDPGNCIVFWGCHPRIPDGRAAKCALRYTESAGPVQGLIVNQRAEMECIALLGKVPDIVFVGTPAVKTILEPFCRKVVVAPIGYDAVVMGIPDWSRPKHGDVCFHGTPVGRRTWLIPILKSRLGSRFQVISKMGRSRQEAVNRCKAALYVGHSEEPGFPGMRLWQAVATSAALITEARDAWPAVPGRHYIAIPPARENDPEAFIGDLEKALQQPLLEIARMAHEELSKYTIEKCIADYVVPEIEKLS